MVNTEAPAGDPLRNWAGSHVFSGSPVLRPRSVEEVAEAVARARHIHAIGSRHSFHDIADSPGALLSLDRLDMPIELDPGARTVTVGAGVRYGELASHLHARGWALHTMASLPHIAVAGTVATATHGSGAGVPNLSAAVRALEIVGAGGTVRRVDPAHPEFAGSVVALGALGVVTRVTLAIEPDYRVAQEVWLGLPWETALARFDTLVESAYSVSLFTDWSGPDVAQVWRKHRVPADSTTADWSVPAPGTELEGARPAECPCHPIPGADARAATEQGGVPGPWHERLPHFRLDFLPSAGDELQSEWLVPRAHASSAIEALRGLGHLITPLLHISEIRTVAADDLWLSTAHGANQVALHMTWRPRRAEVESVLPVVQDAVAPFGARPHWGKLFDTGHVLLKDLYPRWDDARELIARHDPDGVFANDFLRRVGLTS